MMKKIGSKDIKKSIFEINFPLHLQPIWKKPQKRRGSSGG